MGELVVETVFLCIEVPTGVSRCWINDLSAFPFKNFLCIEDLKKNNFFVEFFCDLNLRF